MSMDTTKIDKRIDAAATQAKETVELFAEKIDQATRCADQTKEKARDSVRKGVIKATDKVEQAVTTAAERIRRKATK